MGASTIERGNMADTKKPLIAKFEVQLPKSVAESEFKAAVTGTGPTSTGTGGVGGLPPDTAADVDVDF
jgi:hypothetical protein